MPENQSISTIDLIKLQIKSALFDIYAELEIIEKEMETLENKKSSLIAEKHIRLDKLKEVQDYINKLESTSLPVTSEPKKIIKRDISPKIKLISIDKNNKDN